MRKHQPRIINPLNNIEMKTLKIFLFLSFLGFMSCEDNYETISYDESSQAAILSNDLKLSPEENVKAYLASVDVDYKKVRIYSASGQDCKCSKGKKSCYCKLKNEGYGDHSCDEADAVCTEQKMISIKVAPENKEKFANLGFK